MPVKVTKKKRNLSIFDSKFIICLQEINAPLTQIGSDSNIFCIITAEIKTCPNHNDAINRQDCTSNGFKGKLNFRYLLGI